MPAIPTVSNWTKARIAQYGPNRLLGKDFKDRKDLSREELIVLFDNCWESALKLAIGSSKKVEAEFAERMISEKERNFLDSGQSHYHVRCRRTQLIAQIDEESELTQLWHVKAGDDHPRTLWVTFDTVEERQAFRDLAANLNRDDEELGLELVKKFMNENG